MNRPARGAALVTGGSSGIGAALAAALAERGHPLILAGRRRPPLERRLAELGVDGRALEVDVRDEAALTAAVAAAAGELGHPEIAVAGAGVAHVAPFVELGAERFRETVETNLIGAANLFRAALPAMLERRSGTLVAVLSVAARRVFPGWAAYAASKWGLLGLIESLREELAGTGVRVLALTPGATATPLWDAVPGEWDRTRMIAAGEIGRALRWALDSGDEVAVEEIRLQPPGGNL
jgi:NADP-dependent 3-hydroxy acid dehydrogenase YdfG